MDDKLCDTVMMGAVQLQVVVTGSGLTRLSLTSRTLGLRALPCILSSGLLYR